MGHTACLVSPFDVANVSDHVRIPIQGPAMTGQPNMPHADADQLHSIQFDRSERPARGLRSLPRRILPVNIMQELRLWHHFPDPDIEWARRVLSHFEANPRSFDWVITTSPPESLHRVGHTLAAHCGARWLVELRDSWVINSHREYVRGVRSIVERIAAKLWLRRATAIIAVDPFIAKEAHQLSGRPVITVRHFSEPLVKAGNANSWPDDGFDLVHAGGFSLSDRRRDLNALTNRLDQLSAQRVSHGLQPIRLHILGRLTEEEAAFVEIRNQASVAQIGIKAYGPVSLSESHRLQGLADGLLLYAPEGSVALPGKYSEYALAGRPIYFSGPDIVRKLAASPELLCPLDDLVTSAVGETGRVDTTYRADNVVSQFLDQISQLSV